MQTLDTLTATPPTTREATRHSASWGSPTALAAIAVLIRLVPAVLTYGTSDVMTWEVLGRLLLTGENFYATQLHNWPVLWIYFCAAAVLVHDATGLPFFTLIKLPPIMADAAIAVLVYRICEQRGVPNRRAALMGLAYALNPVSILLSGFHGQFDSLMLAPTVLACYLWLRRVGPSAPATPATPPFSANSTPTSRADVIASGLALGVGVWFKPVPLLLLPILLPLLRSWRARGLFALLALAPAALGTLPYFVRWPQDVAANFFGYSSWFGQWGYPVVWMILEYLRNGTIPWWLPDPDYVSTPLRLMYFAGRWLLVAALAGTWLWIYSRRMELLRAISATFAVFYFVTSGFGVQYLLWIVPFATARRGRWLWPFTFTATALMVVAYSLGSAYMPLDTVPDNAPSAREFVVKLATLPAWIVSGLWAWWLLHRPPTEVAVGDYNRVRQ